MPALLIRGPGIRVPSSAPKGRQIVKKTVCRLFCFIRFWGLVPVIFSKILEVRGTKMKKLQKNYKLNAGESFRLDKNGLHGVTAQGRFKMSLLLVLE